MRPNIEWELDEQMGQTGRWRARQFYARPGDTRVPSEREPCLWRGDVKNSGSGSGREQNSG